MTEIVHASDLTAREKRLLFWASFVSLAAAGFGFSFRVAMGGAYGAELGGRTVGAGVVAAIVE